MRAFLEAQLRAARLSRPHGGHHTSNVSPWLALLIVVFCLALSAFFSGAETALTAASRARMHALQGAGDKRAGVVNPAPDGARAADRRHADRQQRREYRRVRLHDERAGAALRDGRRDLRHGGDVDPRHRVRRGDAQDRGDQQARPDRSPAGAAGVVGRGAVRPPDDGHRGVRPRRAAHFRHRHQREPVGAVAPARRSAARSTCCTGRAASSRRRARCSAASSISRISKSPTS